MKIKDLFFHIHYCKYRQFNESGRYSRKIVKTLDHHELIFIKGGKGHLTIEGKSYQLEEGMLFYICPDVLYTIEVAIEKPGCFLSVHFSFAHVSFSNGGWDVKNGFEDLPLPPAMAIKDYHIVEDAFRKLVESRNAMLPGYEFVSRTLLQELLILIYQNSRTRNRNYSTSQKVEKAIQYMLQNIDGKVTLAELSKVVQLSPAYLSKAFKETMGYSAIEFFNKMKIDRSKELIIEGGKKVKEVAHVLGFTDEFYFSRLFKRIEGISPSEYYNNNVHGV